MRSGSVVTFADRTGVVIRDYGKHCEVLWDCYVIEFCRVDKLHNTGKYFDLNIIWETIKEKPAE